MSSRSFKRLKRTGNKPEWIFVVHKRRKVPVTEYVKKGNDLVPVKVMKEFPAGLTILHGKGIGRLDDEEIKDLMKIHSGELPVTKARDVHILSEEELNDLMRGYLNKEYYMDVIEIPVGYIGKKGEKIQLKERIPVMQVINLKRYNWLPKYLYARFLRAVCEALGIIYRPFMLDAVFPVPLTPKAVIQFKPKPFWVEYERRIEAAKEREKLVKSEFDESIEFLKKLKEYEKEKRK